MLLREYIASGDARQEISAEVHELADLAREQIHPDYPLVETLPFGVGIHYGDMPEIARREQERLFDEGQLRYLVCTGALFLEGVNLPCRNLFVWGPRLGRSKPMNAHAFWNLAGRAGRWGKEFAGNIFCIDVHDSKQWPDGPPRKRLAQRLQDTGAEVLRRFSEFENFVATAEPAEASKVNRYFEQILGELVAAKLSPIGLDGVAWIGRASTVQRDALEAIVAGVVDDIRAPADLIRDHSAINPVLISRFMEFLRSLPEPDLIEYMPMSPDIPDALALLRRNMRVCDSQASEASLVMTGKSHLRLG